MPAVDSRARASGRKAARLTAIRDLLAQVRTEANAARVSRAMTLARKGIRLLEAFPDEKALRAQFLTNLGSLTAVLGDVPEGLRLLDQAVETDPDQTAAAYSTKSFILERTRSYAEALVAIDVALAYRPAPDSRARCTALLRRGLVNTSLGRLTEAINDFTAADELTGPDDLAVLSYMARHNLGWVRYLRGDLPAALAAMEAAQQVTAEKPGGEPALDRSRVLLAAGLLRESEEFADRALQEFRAERRPVELAEALLVMAELSLLGGHPQQAERFTRSAVAESARHHLANLTLIAKLELLRARGALRAAGVSRRGARSDLPQTRELAGSLADAGLVEEAATAHLLEAACLAADSKFGPADEALRQAAELAPRPALAVRLHARLIAGTIALAAGHQARGLTELRRGLDELADFQARFSAQDMQAGASVHGQELARFGLRTAIDTESPALILQWLERARAVSTRLPAVNPPADTELGELLGALRFAAREAREAVLSGHRDPGLDKRVAELRRQVRARSWIVAGSGTVQRPLTLTAVQRLLAADPSDPTVIAYITGRSAIRALIITARRATYRTLGSWEDDEPRHRRRAADLDMLAAARVPAPIRKVATSSVHREFARLSAELVDPVADRLRDGPVVVAVTGELATVPWTLLPGLRGRSVSVSSSVTTAMASGGRPARAHLRGVLAVAGPDVENGAKEAQSVAALHAGAGLLTGEAATGEAVLAQLPAGGLLHIAAHGHHEVESPLFSSVLLADGPLYGYDIAPNPQLPDQVVLSSCDVGRSDIRPGGEPLGLAAALLRSGVSTVVAGVSRISDSLAASVMVAFHQALLAGDGPATALAAAVTAVDGELAPFNCFGAGM